MGPWSRGREVARDVLRSFLKREKNAYFLPSERDQGFLSSVLYTPAAKCIFSDAWQAPATYHRPSCELCDHRVGEAPNDRDPFRFHDAIAVFADRCLTRTRIADQGLGGGFINIALASPAQLNSA